MADRNQPIIDEFRANGGKVGGFFEGTPLLLLHHVGVKTGTERVTPVMYQKVDSGYAVFASKAGADTHPHWYGNLVAMDETTVEVGEEVIRVRPRVAEGEERQQIWSRQKQRHPGFSEYEQRTDRVIPVVILEPAD